MADTDLCDKRAEYKLNKCLENLYESKKELIKKWNYGDEFPVDERICYSKYKVIFSSCLKHKY